MLTVNDFQDNLSKEIYQLRKEYYETGSYKPLLKIAVRYHSSAVARVKRISNRFQDTLQKNKLRIIIFGGGNSGVWTCNWLREHGYSDRLAAFVDNSTDKQDTGCLGLPVWSVQKSALADEIFLYVIPEGIYYQEMKNQLLNEGVAEENIQMAPSLAVWHDGLEEMDDLAEILENESHHFVLFRLSTAMSIGYTDLITMSNFLQSAGLKVDGFCEPDLGPYNRLERWPLRSLGEVLQDTEQPYYVVMDSMSEKCLKRAGVPAEKIIHFANTPQLQYFDETINPYCGYGHEVFIDGGVLDLTSSRNFLEYCHGQCDKIYAFEPDRHSYDLCSQMLERDRKLGEIVNLIPKGLWKENAVLSFASNTCHPGGSRIDANAPKCDCPQAGSETVICTSIDDTLQGGKATFIKFDIEGSELAALQGAKHTIETYHPTLAISVYHKPEDIVTIPEYIKQIAPEYEFYLRCYNSDNLEVVLYALWPGNTAND